MESGTRTRPLRRTTHANLRRRIARKLIPKPPDKPRQWTGTAGDHPRTLNVLRYGDCAWREQDHGHSLGTRPGYPRILADRLARRGIGMGWSWVYLGRHQHLPKTHEELVRFVKLDGAPDVVMLQLSMPHAVRTIVPMTPLWNDLRIHLAHWAGPLARPVYWLMHRALRRFGRVYNPFWGVARVDRFWRLVAERWPDAERIMLSHSCRPDIDGLLDRDELDRVWGAIARRCEERGITVVDSIDAIDDLRARLGRRAVNAYNAYDLREPGHELVADLLLEAIDSRGLADSREPGRRRFVRSSEVELLAA